MSKLITEGKEQPSLRSWPPDQAIMQFSDGMRTAQRELCALLAPAQRPMIDTSNFWVNCWSVQVKRPFCKNRFHGPTWRRAATHWREDTYIGGRSLQGVQSETDRFNIAAMLRTLLGSEFLFGVPRLDRVKADRCRRFAPSLPRPCIDMITAIS